MANNTEDECLRLLDKEMKKNIKSIMGDRPHYFGEFLDAKSELLPYFKGCMNKSQIEKIDREYDRDGNIRAVYKLFEEAPKFRGFSISLLRALHETRHRDIAEKILEGIDIYSIPPCRYSEFLKGFMPGPPGNGSERVMELPPPDEVILQDQMRKEQSFSSSMPSQCSFVQSPMMTSRESPPSYTSTVTGSSTLPLNIAHTDSQTNNVPPPYVAEDPSVNNYSLDSHPSPESNSINDVSPTLTPQSGNIRDGGENILDPQQVQDYFIPNNNNTSVSLSPSSTIRENTEKYQAENDGKAKCVENNVDITANKIQSSVSQSSNCNVPTTLLVQSNVSLHSSELSLSSDSDEDSHTVPKRVISEEPKQLPTARGYTSLRSSSLRFSSSDRDEKSETKAKEIYNEPASDKIPTARGYSPLRSSELRFSSSDSDEKSETETTKEIYNEPTSDRMPTARGYSPLRSSELRFSSSDSDETSETETKIYNEPASDKISRNTASPHAFASNSLENTVENMKAENLVPVNFTSSRHTPLLPSKEDKLTLHERVNDGSTASSVTRTSHISFTDGEENSLLKTNTINKSSTSGCLDEPQVTKNSVAFFDSNVETIYENSSYSASVNTDLKQKDQIGSHSSTDSSSEIQIHESMNRNSKFPDTIKSNTDKQDNDDEPLTSSLDPPLLKQSETMEQQICENSILSSNQQFSSQEFKQQTEVSIPSITSIYVLESNDSTVEENSFVHTESIQTENMSDKNSGDHMKMRHSPRSNDQKVTPNYVWTIFVTVLAAIAMSPLLKR